MFELYFSLFTVSSCRLAGAGRAYVPSLQFAGYGTMRRLLLLWVQLHASLYFFTPCFRCF